ncbi:MAG: hypothetical protein ABI353_06325 [Isosphaeraceae bacterium]
MRWVGIDEAGYGPNLGPLVMSAVVAEGPGDQPPKLWDDLSATVARAGSRDGRLWVDDSKQIYRRGQGLDRLNAATLAALLASGRARPRTLSELLAALEAGDLHDVELAPHWWDEVDPPWPGLESRLCDEMTERSAPLDGAAWRIKSVRSVVVGPALFNAHLLESTSKAGVHFRAFARLLRRLWDLADDGVETVVRGDKHGGRHFYFDLLAETFPEAWIDRGPEGPALSQYTLRAPGRRLELTLVPGADGDDGLVALASILSKLVREHWMNVFNAHWLSLIPGLKPTAGYPVDAARFRTAIEDRCRDRGLDPSLWWRVK